MSTSFKLSLPTDIPWVRKCVSEDMLDVELCDDERPYRWRSSIAVFEYEPDDENQLYPDQIISYLKIACSITGYQIDPTEIGVSYKRLRSYWKNAPGIEDYVNVLEKYYPCYGAILDVSVGLDHRATRSELPYFLDFEPKKRELYELATDSRERQSRSVESLNITKSAGNTQSLEVLDIDMGGGGHSQQGSFFGTGGGYSVQEPNGQWGTRRLNAEESMSARSADVGDERRETYSFATQISQLYHQLDSYHLGTNRAVFFMLPRPHTIESEHTFVNGLRNIEGVQEFFLIVARPKSVKHVCVEAHLETGHIAKEPYTELEQVPGTVRTVIWNGEYHAAPRGNDDETTVYDDKDRVWDVNVDYPGYRIVNAVLTSPGYRMRYNYSKPNLVDVPPHISLQNNDIVRVSGKVHSGFKNYVVDKDRWEEIWYPFTVEITIAKMRVVEKSKDTLFLTGRNLCCCRERPFIRPGITYERDLKPFVVTAERQVPGVPIASVNERRQEVREAILTGHTDLEHRYDQPIDLPHSDFASRALVAAVRSVEDVDVRELPGLSEEIRRKLSRLRPGVHAGILLKMPRAMQRDLFDLSDSEVATLRDSLIGLNFDPPDSVSVWLSPGHAAQLFEHGSGLSDESSA